MVLNIHGAKTLNYLRLKDKNNDNYLKAKRGKNLIENMYKNLRKYFG